MANSSIFLSDLKAGRGSSTVQVPLLRFWKARNVRATIMQASVSVSWLATYRPYLRPFQCIMSPVLMFRNHSEMLGLANTNTQLLGKSEDLEVLETKGYLIIIIFLTISPLSEMGSSSVLEKMKEVREKVEVKKETYSIGRRLLVFMFVAMHAVTGSYARQNFVDYLGAKPDSISHGVPLEDFGHGHPDPNLT
ncbi:hypothetical protein DY000_02004932 [Brassica cretica]|uniref:Uncharacterized protein n=1 Tax=Brassica cretica TaxID=69181 RepID=A0ABQ7CLQ8_BRACR|nr:hypothetical protein DY000_02004932 [Brassica cretica]